MNSTRPKPPGLLKRIGAFADIVLGWLFGRIRK